MGKRRGQKTNAKGRGATEQFVAVPYSMAQSPAWRSLSGVAIKVWFELRSRYNGANNGQLSLSMDEASRTLSMSKSTVQRAFNELQQKGFLRMMRRGQWYGRKATLWAVTDRGMSGQPPTNDWRHWRPSPAPKTASRYSHRTYWIADGSA